jgi:AcrR family transcriptional regulator
MISRERAVQAALKAIDTHGLPNFSLSLVAKLLNVRVPSLYYHFRDKAQILSEVARFILLDAQVPLQKSPDDWKKIIIGTALEVRRSILRHPNAAPLLLAYPPRHIMLAGYERTLRMLERKGMPAAKRITLLSGIDAISWGYILFEAASRSQGVPPFPNYDPHLYTSLASVAELAANMGEEQIFALILRNFLDGLEAQKDIDVPPTAARSPGRVKAKKDVKSHKKEQKKTTRA